MIDTCLGSVGLAGSGWSMIMCAKSGGATVGRAILERSTAATAAAADLKPQRRRVNVVGSRVVIVLAAAGLAAAAYFAYDSYQVHCLALTVRQSLAARRSEEAREPLRRWLAKRPDSSEAHYYRAWSALAADQRDEAAAAIEQATRLGFDPTLLDCLVAIFQARGNHFDEAEPILETAFGLQLEPRGMVAKELARIYLSRYRLTQAAMAIERWRVLVPEDPQPYLLSNEIASRSDGEPMILILNYRAALDRDPNLDRARLGLAQQLSSAGRFDDAKQEFLAYLQRNPNDASARLGLGRIAIREGNIEESTRYYEAVVAANPRQPDALRELGQIDLRLGRFQKACKRLELLTRIEPFDYKVRQAYSQSLRLAGDEARSRAELAQAVRLRKEQDEIAQLKSRLLIDPRDTDACFRVAKWLFDHGHQEEGLIWADEVFRAVPHHAATHRILAEYYEKHGDTGLANYHRLVASAGQEVDGGTSPRARKDAP
jgi:tetratricopeptide (TPR) repeat protein